MALTLEQFKKLRASGLSTEQIAKFESGDKPKTGQTGLGGFAAGFGKEMFKTANNIMSGVQTSFNAPLKGVNAISNKLGGGDVFDEQLMEQGRNAIPKDLRTTYGKTEKIGGAVENVAEFLVPGPAKAKGLGLARRAISGGAEMGLRTFAQEGELNKDVATSAAIGTAFPVIGAGLSKLKKFIKPVAKDVSKSVSSAMTSVPERALERAGTLDEVGKVKSGFDKNVTAETIRTEAIGGWKRLDKTMKTAFENGLDDLQKNKSNVPKITTEKNVAKNIGEQLKSASDDMAKSLKEAQSGNDVKLWTKFTRDKNLYNSLTLEADKINKLAADNTAANSLIKDEVVSGAEGLRKVFNKFGVSLKKGGTLDFDKLNSAIVSPAERNQIQQVYSTIVNQSDFSPKGIQRVASKINALSKFTDGAATQKSAVISAISSTYDDAIKKTFPELAKLRAEYGATKSILTAADDILRVNTKDVKKVQSSIGILTNLFKTDKDAYLKALENLEAASGTKFLSKLAGTEFQRISPGILRTSLAVGGVGQLFNKASALVLLPFFSPRAVGGMITNATQAQGLMREILKISLPKFSPSQIQAVINRMTTIQD